MPALDSLSPTDVARALRAYGDALADHAEALNRLNVYPVPDGDTGTNMSLTLRSVVDELGQAEAQAGDGGLTMEAVAKAMSHGSLMGARGNSGVILSQILRGMASALDDGEAATDARRLQDGLVRAAESAYAAVSNPVEGTILSVAAAAARGAQAAGTGASLDAVLESAREAAGTALARTTEQLPALRQAGVVDAGGAGFVLLLDSLLHVVDGRPLPEPPALPELAPGASLGLSPNGAVGHEAAESADWPGDGVGELRYEVMFFLEVADEAVPAFRGVWAGYGGSIVIVGGDGVYNCHIHTDDVGGAIEAAIEIGRPRRIRVTDLRDQVEEERWVRDATAAGQQEEPPAEPCTCAVVAVCAGEGLRRIFHSLGVQETVSGGQSANPSTAQVLEAIDKAPAEQVIVLPNNPNVVAVAEQAATHSGKKVRVVPTPGIPEGFAALLEYDPEADVETNAENMARAAKRVVAGEVAQASRPATTEAGKAEVGDWLGLSRQGVKVVAPQPSTPADAAIALLGALVADDHEIVTIIEGEGAHAADTRRLVEWLAEHRPDIAAEVLHGGQPLYPYLFSIE